MDYAIHFLRDPATCGGENVPDRVVESLVALGHDTDTVVAEGLGGTDLRRPARRARSEAVRRGFRDARHGKASRAGFSLARHTAVASLDEAALIGDLQPDAEAA